MSQINSKSDLFSEDQSIICTKNADDNILDKRTLKDGLKDVTNHLDGLLIDDDNKKKNTDWDRSKNIEINPIPRIKDRDDRTESILHDGNERNNGTASPKNDSLNANQDGTTNNDENHGFVGMKGKGDLKEEEDDNEHELSLDLDEPSPEVMEYARREVGESDEVKCQTLQELREMIYERGECSPHRVDDAFLIRFLRARNFNVNRAHRLVVRYFDFKEQYPDIHQGVNPLKMRHIGDDDAITVPGYRTQCGRRMMIYRMGNWDPKKYSIEELFKATVIILELGILEPRAQVLGGIVIFDLKGISMAHAWSITPQIASMVMALMVSAFPMKTYAIHILNQSWIFDVIFSMFKPLLHANMQDRIFIHGEDMKSLHKHVAPTSLPKKYGGTREELPYYKWITALSKNRQIVKEMSQLGYVLAGEFLKTMQELESS